MASSNEVFEKIKAIVVEELGEEVSDQITMSSRYIDDLGADSVQCLGIAATIEHQFKTKIPGEVLQKMSTVGDTVKYLAEHA